MLSAHVFDMQFITVYVNVTKLFFSFFYRREVFPDGILYASRESHYSVFKAARMYRMECVKVDTLMSGEIDCADFQRKILQNKDKPAIINVNIGEFSLPDYASLSHGTCLNKNAVQERP